MFPSRIRPIPVLPGQSQQFILKPKYYHTHTTHTQTHVQHQPDRPIPLTVGHNPIHGEWTPDCLWSPWYIVKQVISCRTQDEGSLWLRSDDFF